MSRIRPSLRVRTRPAEDGCGRSPGSLARRVPIAAATATALVGVVNVISALTIQLPGRLASVDRLAAGELVVTAHVLALPAGVLLMVLATYLAKRRRRALWATIMVLVVVGSLQMLDGLDVVEALASWTVAAGLVAARRSFVVRHDDGSLGVAIVRIAAVAAGVAGTVFGTIHATTSWAFRGATIDQQLSEAGAVLTGTRGPLAVPDALAWLPPTGAFLVAAAIGIAGWLVFRPLRVADERPNAQSRTLVAATVRAHGHDTLSAFKLRPDVRTLMSADARAFVSFRIDSGVLVLSGDPVGPEDALPALLAEVRRFATERDLRIAAVGASDAFAELAVSAGLRSLYLGDEAIVDTAGFTLEGRPIKKVRQAVGRIERAGYDAQVWTIGDCDEARLRELEGVSAHWRDGAAERGFSMAMDGLRGDHVRDSVVVVARDGAGRVRGFLHFVPTYGRAAMSLSLMRRDPDTPNGLTEFLIVRAIERLRERGVGELSLNFAAFARWVHAPTCRTERVLGRIVLRADRYFQIESLYRFNAKFFPRWVPRHLLYETTLSLPRTALAVAWVEGQLPRPSIGRERAVPSHAPAAT